MPLWSLAAALLASASLAASQQQPPSGQTQEPTSEQEVGGRLVFTANTVVVVADPDRPPSEASIAGKVETTLLETPRSVSVTERRTLDDRLAVNIANAHDYTAALMAADEHGPAYARGFVVNFYDLRRDGLRTYAWSVREPVGVERIQYLRGPGAILYGDGSPGGLVNMVLRKPLPVTRTEFSASGGSLEFRRFTGDVTGPITEARRVRYRLIGAGEWLENGFDNDERRLSLLPMLSFDVGRNATLNIDGELYHERGRNYRHAVPASADTQRGDFSKLPWHLSVGSSDTGWSGWNVSSGVRLDLQLRPATSFHAALRYTRIGGDLDLEEALSLSADGRTLNRFHYVERSTWQEWQSDTFAVTAARTGPVEHKLVVGAEAGLSTADSLSGSGPAGPIDIYEPVYPPALPSPTLVPTRNDVLRLGLYAHDQIQLHRSLIVVPGVRGSVLHVDDRIAPPSVPSAEQDSREFKFSPSLGVVVVPRSYLSLYASATRGFEPPAPGLYLEDGRALSLADVSAVEGGVKFARGDGRVTASVAAFGTRRTNIPQADGRGFYRQIGQGRSRGIELEFAGRLAAGWFAQAAYAWTRTDITHSAIGGEGNDLPNAPHHNGSVWTRYRFANGRLNGTMVAAGIVHVSNRFLAADNVRIAPAYTRFDLSASYEFLAERLRISVALPNATNRRYVTSGAGQVIWTGQPRQLILQATTRF